jgi:hypothetical protein
MNEQCPSCGVGELSVSERQESVSVPFGPMVSCATRVATCAVCGASLDLDSSNSERVAAATKEAIEASIPLMLSRLEKAGLKNAYVERSFGLPQRTIARWKRGEQSSAMLALLRLLCTYPWLTEVADSGFDPSTANIEVLNAAYRIWEQIQNATRDDIPAGTFVLVSGAVVAPQKFTTASASETETVSLCE